MCVGGSRKLPLKGRRKLDPELEGVGGKRYLGVYFGIGFIQLCLSFCMGKFELFVTKC